MNSGVLFIVATPIGNLQDITFRALETLRAVDGILCEDTRVTKKLLHHYGIVKPLISYHQHSAEKIYAKISSLLDEKKRLALVTDAGTPGIADPGARLINYVRERFPDITISPIPGPSALTAALSVAGIERSQFCFLGWPPHKKGRKTFFDRIATNAAPVVFYESPHRIQKALNELERVLSNNQKIIVLRELTKIYEEILRGTPSEVKRALTLQKTRGEFVVVVFF